MYAAHHNGKYLSFSSGKHICGRRVELSALLPKPFNCQAVSTVVIIVPISGTVNIKIPILNNFVVLYKKGVFVLGTLDKIIDLLDKQNKKQVELCAYIGVKKNAFTNWKAGINHSYKKHIDKIAEFFGVSADYLLGIEEQATKKPLPENEERLMELYNLTADLSESEITALKAFVAGLKANH